MSGALAPALTADDKRVAALLGAVLDVLPQSLVAQRERAHLELAAKPFAELMGEAVVELHLGGLSQRDLTARIWPIGAREVLARAQREAEAVAPLDRARSVPASTLSFLSDWLHAEGALARVPYVELEQDIVDGQPQQWVGPAIRPDFRSGGNLCWTKAELYETGLAVLRALPDWPLPGPLLERFRRFVMALPEGTRLNMMSSLGARAHGPRSGLRMISSGPPDVALQLASLNPTNHARAERLLTRYAQGSIGFDLELTVHGMADYFAFYRRFTNPAWSDSELRIFLDHALGDRLLTRQELQGFRELASLTHRGHLALTFKLVLRDHAQVRLKAYVERLVY